MKINDNRGKAKELTFDDLQAGQVYVSHRLQKYVLGTQQWDEDTLLIVCLESGEIFDYVECCGDVFTEVNAVLQVN